MKKFLFSLILISLTTLSANATTHVFYNNAGHPVSIRYGTTTQVSVFPNGTIPMSSQPMMPNYYQGYQPRQNYNRPMNMGFRPKTIVTHKVQNNVPQTMGHNPKPKNIKTQKAVTYNKNGVIYYYN